MLRRCRGREDWTAWDQVLEDLRNPRGRGYHDWLSQYLHFADLADHPDRVREFAELRDLPEFRSSEQRAGGHISLAIYATARGLYEPWLNYCLR